ncbi:protein of unknown function [Taphrina deformans PYCC 5710]|uniref:Histone acetyltransferase type B catalytic subunit n=1 Tax=Taphrina deformans (strain PYCC 5710 / ATCC 11124 / CBS 356.35 / IMI 108563 / JCM 9778 / NBRC 8474) TaxID=1097556 RepID=R4XER4_TAPDE|nr:protein of unknown function [Taphrina deformans PYCC 5710]|eukprot:CCG84342.1 protein of unknown function [Taphrina deformans PYCC 5710]
MVDKRESGEDLVTLEPQFTYAIFGNSEKIFGFKKLSIDLTFAADTLLPLLEINWTERMDESLGVDIEDLDGLMASFLPGDVYRDRKSWSITCESCTKDFRPHGECQCSYAVAGKSYSIYKASLKDKSFAPLLDRMQIFSIMYIEGASLIDSEDDRFDVYTVYAESKGRYEFVGYCTCYKYFFYDRMNHSFEFVRYRISQFVILPNHQGHGHGGHLYDAITANCLADKNVLEITVEDPSEAFDDLRDRRDLLRLSNDEAFMSAANQLTIDKETLLQLRRALKLAPRQFARLLEMNRLRHEASWSKKQIETYRHSVKERLFKKNKDILAELEPSQRLEKLEETYQVQTADYKRLLNGLQRNGSFGSLNAKPSTGKAQGNGSRPSDLMDQAMRKKPRLV